MIDTHCHLNFKAELKKLANEPIKKTKKWPNEPKNVKITTNRIARIKGDSFLEVAQKTTNNAVKLFNLT